MDKSIKVEVPHMQSKALTVDYKRVTTVQHLLIFVTGAVIITFIALLVHYFFENQNTSQNAVSQTTSVSTTPTPTGPLSPAKPYYGVDVDMSQLLPGSNNYYKNAQGQDYIDIAHNLGITLFRITNVIQASDYSGPFQKFTQDQWNTVLNKMSKDNIKAVILIESPPKPGFGLSSEILSDTYLNFVNQYIVDSNVGNNPDVIGIDMVNEPDLSQPNLNYIKEAAQIIKAKYPNMPVTVGGWKVENGQHYASGQPEYTYNDPTDASLLSNIVDFYAVHIYGFDHKNSLGQYPDPILLTKNFLEQTALVADNKPILVEEFGASSGTTITDQQTLGSMQLQANAYSGLYQAIQDEQNLHVIGSTSYLFSPRAAAPDSWSIMSKDGNTLNPAAYVLQKYATGSTSNATANAAMSTSSFPNPHIFTNSDNGQTETVNVGDPVGFILNLPPSKNYKAVVSSISLANITQPMTAAGSAYNVVFQTEKPGNVVFTIYNNPSCTAGEVNCFKNVVYIVNINIQ